MGSGAPERPVVVAVVFVRVVKATLDEVVGVVAVGNGFVSAAGTVGVCAGVVNGGCGVAVRVFGVDCDRVFVDVVFVGVVQVAVVEVVDVSVVLDRDMSAIGAVSVLVGPVREVF